MASEESPLLTPDQRESSIPNYEQPSTRQNNANSSSQSQLVSVPAVGLDDLPPSYEASLSNGNLISCKVCSFMIDISGKREQHVVKCSNCKEETPIKNAPPGKKYVRCPCSCLLICESNSERISCPRSYCKRIINLAQNPTIPSAVGVHGMCRVSCGVCHNSFFFYSSLSNYVARCPHCKKVSSIGYHYARHHGFRNFVAAVLSMILSIAVIVSITNQVNKPDCVYVVYICLPATSVLLLVRAIYFFTMKVSIIEGPL